MLGISLDDYPLAKAILAAWNSSDGNAAISGYGLQPADIALYWGDRDGWALAAFVNWWNNSHMIPPLPQPSTKNEIAWQNINDQTFYALKSWAAGKGITVVPGQPTPTFPSTPPRPPAWSAGLPWPPPKPDWWPVLAPWPPVGVDWGVGPLTKPPSWDTIGLPWPPPLPGSSGYPYPNFQWPPNLWPIPPSGGGAQTPAPSPQAPLPRVPVPNPGNPAVPSCDPGFHYDETTKLCQPDLPPAQVRKTPSGGAASTSESGNTGILVAVGALVLLGLGAAIFGGGASFGGSKPTGRARDNPKSRTPAPMHGYAYVARGKNWRTIGDEKWDTGLITPDLFKWRYVGQRPIDGVRMNVWSKSGGEYIAQTARGGDPRDY
jgi:hypothetical protein